MAKRAPTSGGKNQLDPSSLSAEDLAKLLTKAGTEPITEDMIKEDIAEGAPTNADGRLNLVHYAAWLVKVKAVVNCHGG